jgi:hypothetical protein
MYPFRGGPFTMTVREALDWRVVVDTSRRRRWGPVVAAVATAVRTNRYRPTARAGLSTYASEKQATRPTTTCQ